MFGITLDFMMKKFNNLLTRSNNNFKLNIHKFNDTNNICFYEIEMNYDF